MIDIVEQTADVILQHPVSLPAPFSCYCERIMCRFPGPIPIGVVMKDRLQ